MVDDESKTPRGKVQLTFEESLKKAGQAKPKTPKTLDQFFGKSPSSSKSEKSKKHEISVDDFFGKSKVNFFLSFY